MRWPAGSGVSSLRSATPSHPRSEDSMRKTRLTAFLAVLLLASSRWSRRAAAAATTHQRRHRTSGRAPRRRWRRRAADRRLRHPLSPVRAGQTRRIHGLRHRTDGSDRRKDRPHAGIPGHLVRNDLPRRRPGQVRRGDLGRDDHRRTRESGRLLQPLLPLRTGDAGQRRQRHQIARRRRRQDRRRPAGHDRPGTRQGKTRRAANSGRSRKAPTRSTRSKRAPSKR